MGAEIMTVLLLVQAALFVIALLLGVTFYLRLQSGWKKMREQQLPVRGELEELSSRFLRLYSALERRIKDLEERPLLPAEPRAPGNSVDLARRSQVLRLHREGESLERIAAAVSAPVNEVELIIKVHRLLLEHYTEHPATREAAEGRR